MFCDKVGDLDDVLWRCLTVFFFRDEEDCAVPSYNSVSERDFECRYSKEYALQCEEDEEMA
jgi:hypothetical protein